MLLCYVDEAGDTRDLSAAPPHGDITPVFVIAGVVFDHLLLEAVTRDFLKIKERFFPGLIPTRRMLWLDRILPEIKGADVRRSLRKNAQRRNRRQALGFLGALISLLENYDARIFGRIWIKPLGAPCDDRAVYTFSVQAICTDFENLLETSGDYGAVIADSRNPQTNAGVSHSIFTQKFKTGGDTYPRLVEMPTFGHSENHAGIQIADLLCSAIVFPMATRCYCWGHVKNVHVDYGFSVIVELFGERLKRLQHRYVDHHGRPVGGLTVSDPLTRRNGAHLFRRP